MYQTKCFQSMILNMVLTFCLKSKIRKKCSTWKKNILLLNIYNFENIFCNFLMIKKRQECNNSTVYRTRIENILVTQFEFFFEKSSWLVKFKNSIKNAILSDIFPYFMHNLGTFIIFSIISHSTQYTIWHFKSNKTYFFEYLLVNNYFDMFTINMIKVS